MNNKQKENSTTVYKEDDDAEEQKENSTTVYKEDDDSFYIEADGFYDDERTVYLLPPL